jgi:hypothetical protein
MKSRTTFAFIIISSLISVSSAWSAPDQTRIDLRRNDAIPVRFEDTLSFSKSHEGDRFSAKVDNDRDLPKGTRFEGRVVDIRHGRRDEPGTMTLEFDRLILPGGREEKILATPIAWNQKYLSKNRDGRWEAKQGDQRDRYVLGGLAGGLIVGSIAKKPFEGAFIGALAGILIGESEKASNADVVIRKGDKVGALIERDVRVGWNDRDDLNNSQDKDRQQDRGISIYYDGKELRYDRDESPYESGQTVMVPLERTAKLLGFNVELEDRQDRIFIEGDNKLVRLDRTSREYRVNGDRRTLSRNLEERESVLYVPLEVFKALVDRPFKVNGTKLEDKEY